MGKHGLGNLTYDQAVECAMRNLDKYYKKRFTTARTDYGKKLHIYDDIEKASLCGADTVTGLFGSYRLSNFRTHKEMIAEIGNFSHYCKRCRDALGRF